MKSVQRRDRRRSVRKVLFIDVSKAHLYAPVGEGIKNYVELPPECGKPGVCGLLNFWLYGMRLASHGWQEEYTKQLLAMGFKPGEASPAVSIEKQTMFAALSMVTISPSKVRRKP